MRQILTILVIALVALPFLCRSALAADNRQPLVRIAEIVVASGKMEAYKAAVHDVIDTSVRVEPGVLALYAVAHKDDPARITVFEIYANEEAYKSHRETAHFKKYKEMSLPLVQSLTLVDTDVILLRAKGKQ